MDRPFEIIAMLLTNILILFVIVGQAHEIKDLKHQINVMQNETELSCKSYCETEFEKNGLLTKKGVKNVFYDKR